MSKQSNELSAISNGHKTRGSSCIPTRAGALSVMRTLTLLVIGVSSTLAKLPPALPGLATSTGWYTGCPLIWASQIQTGIALSMTEAAYVALSTALSEVTFVMQLLTELISFRVQLTIVLPEVKCKVFEDNGGPIGLAKAPRMCPRTKHIHIQYHHFQEDVARTEKYSSLTFPLTSKLLTSLPNRYPRANSNSFVTS
jgi:hypothetical protein